MKACSWCVTNAPGVSEERTPGAGLLVPVVPETLAPGGKGNGAVVRPRLSLMPQSCPMGSPCRAHCETKREVVVVPCSVTRRTKYRPVGSAAVWVTV